MFTKPPTSGHPTVVPSRGTLDSSTSLRWGILGPGRIAPRLVRAVRKSMRAELVAVASRDAERAATFADQYSAEVEDLTAAILDGDPPRVDLDFSRGNCATLVRLDAAARSQAVSRID